MIDDMRVIEMVPLRTSAIGVMSFIACVSWRASRGMVTAFCRIDSVRFVRRVCMKKRRMDM